MTDLIERLREAVALVEPTDDAERMADDPESRCTFIAERPEAIESLLREAAAALEVDAWNTLWCKKASELLPPWQWNRVNDAVIQEQRLTAAPARVGGG